MDTAIAEKVSALMKEAANSNLLKSGFFRISVLVVVLAYFAFASHWLFVTLRHTPTLIANFQEYSKLLKESWWIFTYYSSELGLSAGIVFRWIAGIIAVYVAAAFAKDGWPALSRMRRRIGVAVLLEGFYVLTYTPSAFLGFVYPIAKSRNLWYFEPSPPWVIVFLVNGLACTGIVSGTAPFILKLGARIIHGEPKREVTKWASITGVGYLFAMFWWNYAMCWAATLVYWPERAQPGIEILYNPIAASSFTATVVGLLLIAIFALKEVIPAMKEKTEDLNKLKLGYVLLAFSSYFILMLILYVAAGGYYAQPTIWMEIIGPHNPDLWCISLIIPGICLVLKSKKCLVT